MANSLELWKQKLDELGTKVGSANDLVSQYQGASYQVPELAKKRVSEMYNNNQDLIAQETAAQKQLTTTPSSYLADMQSGQYANNPILAGKAAAMRMATIEQRLQNIRGIKQERMGTQSDIINAATNAFGAQTQAAQSVAKSYSDQYQNAWQGYQSAYAEEQDRITAERQRRQDEEDKRRDEEDKRLELAKFEEDKRQFNVTQANKGGGGGGSQKKTAEQELAEDIASGINEILKTGIANSGTLTPWATEDLIERLKVTYPELKGKSDIGKLVYDYRKPFESRYKF